MNEKIAKLQREIDLEREKMSSCSHEWGETFYDPEMKSEAYGSHIVATGSDVWSEPDGYAEKLIARWTRVCKKCGYEQHTDKTKPVKYEPSFD